LLSKMVHAWVLARGNRRKAWAYWLQALESDIADLQGGTTGEGIHLGARAGTVDRLQRAFTGLETVTHDSVTVGGSAVGGAVLPLRVRDQEYRQDAWAALRSAAQAAHRPRRVT